MKIKHFRREELILTENTYVFGTTVADGQTLDLWEPLSTTLLTKGYCFDILAPSTSRIKQPPKSLHKCSRRRPDYSSNLCPPKTFAILTVFHADFGKEFPSRTLWGDLS